MGYIYVENLGKMSDFRNVLKENIFAIPACLIYRSTCTNSIFKALSANQIALKNCKHVTLELLLN